MTFIQFGAYYFCWQAIDAVGCFVFALIKEAIEEIVQNAP